MSEGQVLTFVQSPKRVRVTVGAKTVADSVCATLLLERGHMPVYYFPRDDVLHAALERSNHRTTCPRKGEASYWHLKAGGRTRENAVWGYESPIEAAVPLKDHVAFYWNKVDHWFEEDEEIFGHPRDPYHRIDVRSSSRIVRATLGNLAIAETRRALFLFETGVPTRYYIPPEDIRMDLLTPSATTSTCPYKGQASYFSARVPGHAVPDIAWCYREPLPECPRIRGHLCFYPEKLDHLEVEGEISPGRAH